MKKLILFLTLFSILSIQAQVSTGKEQEFDTGIKNNAAQTVTTPINVVTQGSDGTLGKTLAGNLIEVLEYSTASAMPVTGVSGKIYVTIDSGRLYRWNGTVYTEISTGGVTSVSGLNGVTVTNPTTTPIIGLGDITPTTVTTNSTTLTPITAPSYAEGKVFYDSSAKTLVAYDDISGTSTNLGQELNLRARNNTGVTITNGSVVYISGATGQNPTIALARANSLLTSVTIGIATHDIANNTIGKITTFGLVNDLNTSAFTDGQILYVSPTTAGTLTATVPSSPNYTAHVCVVLHSHITQGKIFVRPEQPISLNTALTDNNNTSPSVSAVKSYIDTGLSSKIGGSGTVGTLPMFTSTGILGNSAIIQSNGLLAMASAINSSFKLNIDILGSTAPAGLRVNSNNVVFIDPLGTFEFKNDGSNGLISYGGRGLKIRTQGSTNPMTFEVNTSEKLRINNNGNVLIGTAIDNGIDQLQIPNGTISAQPATLSNQVVVKSQLDLKANIANPTFTGVPSVPTAAAGTNTTQIASTAFVLENVNAQAVTLTGNQSVTGNKIFSQITMNSSANTEGIFNMYLTGAGKGFNHINTGSGQLTNIFNQSTGTANRIVNNSTGLAISLESTSASTGNLIGLTKNGVATTTINHLGEILTIAPTQSSQVTTKSYVDGFTPKQLKDFYTDVNNVGITETDLYSYTTTASRLNATGEKIVAVYGGTMNDATASSQLKVYFGGILIGDTGVLTMNAIIDFKINVSIIRTGATTARAILNIATRGASTPSYTEYTALTGLTFTNTNILKVTGTASGATGGDNDITATYGNIIWQPAAL